MALRVMDRLNAVRQHRFVGRISEQTLFRSVLASPELPFYVLHIYGPGGVGKTSLLKMFVSICEQEGIPTLWLDGRLVDGSPDAFLNALRAEMEGEDHLPTIQLLTTPLTRQVILVDSYELLVGLDDWLREVFLPSLSDNILVVLAGRMPPQAAWLSDLGWQPLLHPLPLQNLKESESRDYLARRGIPPEQQRAVLDFTHGHPLALSLVADLFAQRQALLFQPEDAPDIIKALLEQFVQKLPGPAHRTALEICALVRLTSQELLSSVMGTDGWELFEWLRGLSFIESTRVGLAPHDLAREALVADLRWRDPTWYAELHARIRAYYSLHLQQTRGQTQQRLLLDYIFLYRENPVIRPLFAWQESCSTPMDSMQREDIPALLEMVAHHEGETSASLAAFWFERQPESILLLRDADRKPVGFMMQLALHRIVAEEREVDPAVQQAYRYLAAHGPLQEGEQATLFRFWMDRESYQGVSPTQSRLFVSAVQHYFTTPDLAFTFLPCATPEFWLPGFTYANLERLHEADFVVADRTYGVYGHDWRQEPPMTWLTRLAEKEVLGGMAHVAPSYARAPTMPHLGEAEFADAVRKLLRDWTRRDVLGDNVLLRSHFLASRSQAELSAPEQVALLQGLVLDAAATLQQNPRDAKLFRALYHTYFQPAVTQEKAAELLDIPFSTYRRHLKAGISRLIEMLWQWELISTKEGKK